VSTVPVAITGLGSYLPEQVVTNDDLAQRLDTSDEWIRTRTGIAERHYAAPHEATSDLAIAAARAALTDAGLTADDVDVIIVATTTPDHPVPATAPIVAAALGRICTAFDLNAACSGFVYGLQVGAGIAAAGSTVLLIGAETLTRYVDHDDRSIAVLFGDGAGAVVLQRDACHHGALRPRLRWQRGRDPLDACRRIARTVRPRRSRRGLITHEHARWRRLPARGQRMTSSSQVVLDAAGISIDDIDLMVGHQANQRILEAVGQRLGVPEGRSHITVDRHGNTSAASIPLALDDARRVGRLEPGSRLLLTAFGGGLTWGSCVLTWSGTAGGGAA
jgi:3-oxoacyl-[acyl-carrier-protein] synthase III